VFLDWEGTVLAFGESGWSKRGRGKEIDQHLTHMLVSVRGQSSGYGGISCAEPEAILDTESEHTRHMVAYSLAYDQQAGGYKAACGSCEKYFAKGTYNRIIDLGRP
jgi:hypothetical protein